jgi:hypothetical protein
VGPREVILRHVAHHLLLQITQGYRKPYYNFTTDSLSYPQPHYRQSCFSGKIGKLKACPRTQYDSAESPTIGGQLKTINKDYFIIMKKFIIALVSFSPAVAFAQSIAPAGINPSNVNNATTLAQRFSYLFGVAISVLIGLAVLWIIISVVVWLVSSGSEGAAKWRNNALWGIVGLAIILSIWGLVHLLTNTATLSNNGLNAGEIPTVPYTTP